MTAKSDDGNGKGNEPQPTNVVHLPKSATIIPKETAKKAQREFKRWKQTFVKMINRGCNIEWRRMADGSFGYKFILPSELCKIVYEIQVNERIRAQMEHAARHCKEKGIVMPSKQEIERIALANLQQEFMAITMRTMQQMQQPAADAEPKKDEPTAEEEAEAQAKIQQLREQLVKGEGAIDDATAKIKEELATREVHDAVETIQTPTTIQEAIEAVNKNRDSE